MVVRGIDLGLRMTVSLHKHDAIYPCPDWLSIGVFPCGSCKQCHGHSCIILCVGTCFHVHSLEGSCWVTWQLYGKHFWGNAKLISRVTAPLYSTISNVWEFWFFPSLHLSGVAFLLNVSGFLTVVSVSFSVSLMINDVDSLFLSLLTHIFGKQVFVCLFVRARWPC